MGIPDAVKIRFTSPVVNFFLWGWLFASGKQSTPNTQDRQRPGPRANLTGGKMQSKDSECIFKDGISLFPGTVEFSKDFHLLIHRN